MSNIPPARQADLDLALHLAEQAAAIARRWFTANDLQTKSKADGSPVTRADVEIEARLRELLAKEDPDASIIGEESDVKQGSGARTWYIDPIDGTGAFVRNVPLFSTLIALHDENGPAIGVIGLPALTSVVAAGRSLGCTKDGRPCSVSGTSALRGAAVTTWGYDQWPPSLFTRLQEAGCLLRGWSDGYGWALLAAGDVDAVIDFGVNPWDLAPMEVILAEAGGRFSDFDGAANIEATTVIGSNGRLHSDLLTAVQA